MDDDSKDVTARPEPTRPSKRLLDAFKKHVARPPKRSQLFWWLIDHHDDLRELEATGGLGIPWRQLCVDIAAEGITAAGGRPVTWETARKTWQRVRKEIVCVEDRRAREQAEREARRAADPRRNMPSRFGKAAPVGPPLSDRQPRPQPAPARVASRALVPVGPSRLPVASSSPAMAANGSGDEAWRNLELPAVLADVRLPDWNGEILDLRQFFRDDGVPEPWEDPDMPDDERIGCLKITIWSRAKEWARHRPYERRFMKKW
jgi:hypothetical protein